MQSVQRSTFSVVNDKIDPFEDVRLGAMLGRGAFGRVYRGQWNGTAVAVKVLEHNESANGEMMEALLSSKLSHPNVVRQCLHSLRMCLVITDFPLFTIIV